MQSAESPLNRSALVLALRRYSTAVQNMEQTVLLPSMLRDVPAEDNQNYDAANASCQDLYEYYLMLKAIRNMAESSLKPLDEGKAKTTAAFNKTLEPMLESDLEDLFHFHLKGLFSVMVDLSKKTQILTEKYMDIIGIAN